MIFLEVDSVPYEGFTEISVARSLRSLSGSFKFAATSSRQIQLPIRRGQSCRVLIDENPVINGFVERVYISYSDQSHTIEIEGRDRTMDAIDSSSTVKELSGNLPLESVIRRVLDGNGLQDIEVINNVSDLENFKEGDIESAEVGETVFSYIEKYARKRQVLLTGDGNGNIVITRAGNNNAITALVNVVDGDNNNVKSAEASYSETETYNQYIVRSQQNPVALLGVGDISTANIVDQSGIAIDNDVRDTRKLEIRPSQSGSNNDSKQFALWQKNIRRAKAFNYKAVVQGYYQDSGQTRLWVPNEIVSVNDDFVGMGSQLRAKMLVDTVKYNLSRDEGSTTTISCVNKDAYTLQPEPDARDLRANDLGV